MFGTHSYDPIRHAGELGVPIIYRHDLPGEGTVACYSEVHQVIFVRPGLNRIVERCAIAHEIVHYEHADVGTSRLQEDRACRLSAKRLISLEHMREASALTDDLIQIALAVGVTRRIMETFLTTHDHHYYPPPPPFPV